jgi:hypothetical protein
LEYLKGRDDFEVIGVDGRIIIEWILWKWGERCALDVSGSGQGPVNAVMNLRREFLD